MPSESEYLLGGRFVAREREFEGLRRWLRHSWASSIAVLGPAGVGKTALIRKFSADSRERSRPFIWLNGAQLRSIDDLWSTLRPQLREQRNFKSVVVALDNLEAFAGGSELEANRLRESFRFDRFDRRRELREDFFGDVNWILIGRKLPWRTFPIDPEERNFRLAEDDWEHLDEPPFMWKREDVRTVVLAGFSEPEIADLLDRSLHDGPPLPAKSRTGLASLIKTRLDGNPMLTGLLIEEIRRTGDPLAAIAALRSRTNLSISLAGDSLKVAATAELAPMQIEVPSGLVTVFPNLYLPKLGQRWREAIHEFEILLNRPNLKEAALQKFFETHPHFLKGLDYCRMVAHPVLERLDGQGNLIPDFFLQPADGMFADIWDLKLPTSPLIVGTKDRLRFSAAVSEALAQVREYRDYFEDAQNRRKIEDRYGLTSYRPTVAIVIGTNKLGLSAEKQKQIFDSVPKDAKVVTYDQLLVRMKRHVELHV